MKTGDCSRSTTCRLPWTTCQWKGRRWQVQRPSTTVCTATPTATNTCWCWTLTSSSCPRYTRTTPAWSTTWTRRRASKINTGRTPFRTSTIFSMQGLTSVLQRRCSRWGTQSGPRPARSPSPPSPWWTREGARWCSTTTASKGFHRPPPSGTRLKCLSGWPPATTTESVGLKQRSARACWLITKTTTTHLSTRPSWNDVFKLCWKWSTCRPQ